MNAPKLTDAELIEDMEFHVHNRVGMREAAKRAGYTTAYLERRLYDLHRHGLVAQLRANDPAPTNTIAAIESRYVKWCRTPLGRRVRDDAGKWLNLTAASWPDNERDQEKRRVDLILATDHRRSNAA